MGIWREGYNEWNTKELEGWLQGMECESTFTKEEKEEAGRELNRENGRPIDRQKDR